MASGGDFVLAEDGKGEAKRSASLMSHWLRLSLVGPMELGSLGGLRWCRQIFIFFETQSIARV